MSAAVSRFPRPTAATSEYLGPADVSAVFAHEVLVTLPDGEVARAELAFALPYAPAIGDTLLVIGRGAKHYAIGVIRGSGQTDLSFQGNVQLRAVSGTLSLAGDEGVEIRGRKLDVFTGALQMVAREVRQTFESMCQNVTSLLRVHAGESQTLVDKGTYTQAKSASLLTDETVTINGREVHIG